MRKVNILEFRKEVLAIIEANRQIVTGIEAEKGYSIFTFSGANYACEVTLNDKWIGYDLNIETQDGTVGCGLRNDTDIYPIYGGVYEEIVLEIYDDLLNIVNAIFSGNIYYATNEKYSYTAVRNDDGTYSVDYWERKKLIFWRYATGWTSKEYSSADFQKLELNVLS